MTPRNRRIILLLVVFQLVVILGLLALPRMVAALPGSYLVRLQNHRLTGPVVQLVTTPLPAALPAAHGGSQAAVASGQVPQIPGLDSNPISQNTPAPSPTATATLPPTPTQEAATPEATAIPPTATPTATPSPTPSPPPAQVMLEGLTTEVQGFNNCGPANMTIALNFWGDSTTQEEAAAYLKPNREDRNVSPWQISDYVNDFTGLRSTAHARGDLEMLKRLVAAGFPVVIEKGYEPQQGTEGWYGHYLTVFGYDDEKQELYSRDTYLGPFDGSPRIDDYEEFMEWWRHFYYTFYVIYPAQREAEVLSIIPEPLQNDWTMWQYAAEQARLDLQEDPDEVFNLFNLGVALTRLGEYASPETVENYSESVNAAYYQEAAQIFDQARNTNELPPRTLYYEHRPLMAYYQSGRYSDVLDLTTMLLETSGGRWVEEIYWYRGHALAATGDLGGAQEAYEKALEVNPNFYYAQISLDWVNSLLEG